MNKSWAIGLYGSVGDSWRPQCIQAIQAAGLTWFNPETEGWDGITSENGDQLQDRINQLVARELNALQQCQCVIWHIAAVNDSGHPQTALASRVELGFLAGNGIRSFVHVEPDVMGRNYLWAHIHPFTHMTRCDSLDDALAQAVTYARSEG